MSFIFSVFITGFLLCIILVLFFQGKNNLNLDDHIDLDEWDCPMCGFKVQMGDICTYCYTKKTK